MLKSIHRLCSGEASLSGRVPVGPPTGVSRSVAQGGIGLSINRAAPDVCGPQTDNQGVECMSLSPTGVEPRQACLQINERSPVGGLFEGDRSHLHPDSQLPWLISPEPYWLTPAQAAYLERLGHALHAFGHAANLLYHQSVRGIQPEWVHQYLDQGKPAEIVELGRMNRFKSSLPLVLRPDLLLTDDGFCLVELDAVPGGMGFTAQVAELYAELGYELLGGARGLIDDLYAAIADTVELERPVVALVVSDESQAYRDEMEWLAHSLLAQGLPIHCRHPREIHFDENGLFLHHDGRAVRVDAVYRFFELFDLKNIPKAEPVTYFAKKNQVRVTPPLKAYLEEKMWLGFFHHPLLRDFWTRELGEDVRDLLSEVIPATWIVDPRPLPPHAVIPGLYAGGHAVGNWEALKHLTKKQREFVIKPSGFSNLAYESRGVSVGHDLPEQEWAARVQHALDSFREVPHILQNFHKARRTTVRYYDFGEDAIKSMRGRLLLRPYYYVHQDEPHLAGTQAVICPPDKKVLHGMVDGVLTPCAVREQGGNGNSGNGR